MEIGRQNNKARPCAAFTLIEMILVMAIMMILLSVIFPSLKGFFRGRNLDNEARRFLSVTRYGQSRAISEGLPVELWINPKQGSYGLQSLSGYTETQTNPMVYPVDHTVQISFSAPTSVLTRSNYWTQASGQLGAVAKIRFQPDGFISDTSPEKIIFRQSDGSQIMIAETPSHLRYDIQPAH
ncbi:MAG TPA: GspH/FimT family pseudopilin [Verrucomicrobiae bacterium]|jgi:type II secretion system protein H|nr:GspH/FimT family pseudopilin [Verrucomicrobiae bacterium]